MGNYISCKIQPLVNFTKNTRLLSLPNIINIKTYNNNLRRKTIGKKIDNNNLF